MFASSSAAVTTSLVKTGQASGMFSPPYTSTEIRGLTVTNREIDLQPGKAIPHIYL